jgi:hypothetical protein
MLKRNGEPYAHTAAQNLNRGETDAYDEALESIKADLEGLKRVRDHVRGLIDDPTTFTIPSGSAAGAILQTRNVPVAAVGDLLRASHPAKQPGFPL